MKLKRLNLYEITHWKLKMPNKVVSKTSHVTREYLFFQVFFFHKKVSTLMLLKKGIVSKKGEFAHGAFNKLPIKTRTI